MLPCRPDRFSAGYRPPDRAELENLKYRSSSESISAGQMGIGEALRLRKLNTVADTGHPRSRPSRYRAARAPHTHADARAALGRRPRPPRTDRRRRDHPLHQPGRLHAPYGHPRHRSRRPPVHHRDTIALYFAAAPPRAGINAGKPNAVSRSGSPKGGDRRDAADARGEHRQRRILCATVPHEQLPSITLGPSLAPRCLELSGRWPRWI